MNTKPDPALILDHIEAFRHSKTMFTAVRLGVFDELARAPQDAAQMARAKRVNADALERLLNGCVALGLLIAEDGRYRNSEAAAQYLVSTSPDTLAGYIVYSDQSLFALWSHLGDAIREGSNRWTQAFGGRNALFDHYFRDETSTASFLGGMHGFGQLVSDKIVRAFDLSGFRKLVDLGGATGHLAIAAGQAYPDLHAAVMDLPPVIPFAERYISQSAAADRLEAISGDFFADPLPPADLYSLGRILHDWGEERINLLLPKIFAALPVGGALLVVEKLMDDSRTGPLSTVMQDLNMLVCTDGRERTARDYESLLSNAGFSAVRSVKTGSMMDAVLARKG